MEKKKTRKKEKKERKKTKKSNFLFDTFGDLSRSASIAIFCLVTETRGRTFR